MRLLLPIRPAKYNFSLLRHFLCFVIFGFIICSKCLSQNPINISGLKLWLKSDTGVIYNSSKVSTWNDKSGNSNHANQSNISLQPDFVPNVLNALPAVRFNGNSLLNGNLINSLSQSSITIFIVASGAPMSDSYNVLFDIGPYAPGGLWLSKHLNEFTIYSNNAIYSTASSSILNTGFSPTIFELKKDFGNISQSFLNLSLLGSSTNSSFINSFVNGMYNVGGDPTYNGLWNGDIFEIIVFDKMLNASENNDINDYLITKYSPILNLGPDINLPSLQGCIPSNTVTIQANPDFQSYLWNNGNTTNQIAVNQYGEYSVICTDIFGINHYDTIKVRPSPKNFNYPSSNIICGNGSITWNTQLSKTENQFQWQDNSTDSLLIINIPGQYFVTVTDTFGCVYNSNTVTISQDNFTSSVSLGPDVSLCAGNSITLTNGASPSLTYTWSNGSTNDSLIVTTGGQYFVVVTNTNNCVARDTINVTIQGLAPVANFSASIGCQNTAVSFTNLSSPPSGNTITASNWDFGDTTSGTFNTSIVNNPFHTFSDTGTYTVRLNVTTDAGCEQSITKTIHIAPNPTVNFSIGNSCQNDSTAFSNQSTSAAGYSITSLNWNFGDSASGALNTSSATNPKHVFGSQTTYTVSLTATNNVGCSTTTNSVVVVKGQVKADFTYSTPCTNTATIFQDNSIASSTAANTRSWNFGGPPVSGLIVPRIYTATGPYNVSLTVSVNGCTSSINKIITIFSPPLVSFTIPAFCSKDTITAINSSVAQSGTISSYNWRLNNNSFSSIQSPTLSLTNAGNYPVRLTVVNSFGCKDSLTKTITVNPLPNIDFTTSPANYYYINEPIGFIPSITNAASYSWIVSGVATSTLQNPSVSINSEGTYTASLNIQDQQGCKNSKTKTIFVSKRYLDLAILNVTTIKDDDGFMTVVADIANYGTVPATTINLQYQISDGGNNIETWNGILNPNSFFTYTFNSKSASQANSTNNITCVSIKKVNGVDDENPNNNDSCSALYYDEISVSNPFPNPTAENITLPIILNKDIDFTLSIYNSTGQMLLEETTQKGILGLNLVSIPTSSYAWGCYILKVVIDDKLFIKKFIKVNN